MIKEDYGAKIKPITKRNPQANSIVERVHQTIGNMLRTFQVHDRTDLPDENPLAGILSAIAFAVQATVHTTTRASPSQLVFGRNAILNIQHQVNWKFVKDRKEKMIRWNNERENALRRKHDYHVGDMVMIKTEQRTKYGTSSYLGPYEIVKVNTNGTVRIREGTVTDTYNIRNVSPYTQ